jgi:glyoxylate reductase
MSRILTALRLPPSAEAILESLGGAFGPEDWKDRLGTAEALITLVTTRVDATLLDAAPCLRIVANAGVGYDNIDLEECGLRGVVATNTPDVLTDATADLTIALILATVRRLPQAERSLRAGEFQGWGFWDYLGGDVSGATLGIFGMGRIGRAVARRAASFGMRVQYTRRAAEGSAAGSHAPIPGAVRVDWETLLSTSDILSLHAPASAETHHLLNATSLRRMKRGAYLINTARGTLLDEAALVEVLRDGHLAGAGLDVYEHEPAVHPGLLELPSAVLLPHIGSATPATRTAMATLAARNVAAVLTGGEPLTPVST